MVAKKETHKNCSIALFQVVGNQLLVSEMKDSIHTLLQIRYQELQS